MPNQKKSLELIPLQRTFCYQTKDCPAEQIKTSLALVGLSHSPENLDELLEINHHSIQSGFTGGGLHMALPALELWALRKQAIPSYSQDLVRKIREYSSNQFGPRGGPCWSHQDMAEAVFAECVSSSARAYKEYLLSGSPTFVKLRPDLLKDAVFLKALTSFPPDSSLPPTWEVSKHPARRECHCVPGREQRYFLKRLSLPKVPTADYEMGIAERVLHKGLSTPRPCGAIVSGSIPYIVFEFQDSSINLFGWDWRHKSPGIIRDYLKQQQPEVFTALGRYIRIMLDRGVLQRDAGRRNFIASFDEEGRFVEIMAVDFEETTIKKQLETTDRMAVLKNLEAECTTLQKKYLIQGYCLNPRGYQKGH